MTERLTPPAPLHGHRHAHVHAHDDGAGGACARSRPSPWAWDRSAPRRRSGVVATFGWYQLLRPVVVGLVHGLAGSAAVALLVLATIQDTGTALVYLVIFCVGVAAGMAVLTTVIGLPFWVARARSAQINRWLTIGSGVLSLALRALPRLPDRLRRRPLHRRLPLGAGLGGGCRARDNTGADGDARFRGSPSDTARWLILLALPLAGLVLLIARPELDLEWRHQPSHFWLVLGVAGVNVALAYLDERGGEPATRRAPPAHLPRVRSERRVPGAPCTGDARCAVARIEPRLRDRHAGRPDAGLRLCGRIGTAARRSARSTRAATCRKLRAGIVGLMAAWGAASLLELPPLNAAVPPAEVAPPLRALALVAVAPLRLAAWHFVRLSSAPGPAAAPRTRGGARAAGGGDAHGRRQPRLAPELVGMARAHGRSRSAPWRSVPGSSTDGSAP